VFCGDHLDWRLATDAVELERLLSRGDTMTAAGRQYLRDALLRYCAVDTMSMLRRLERLRELVWGCPITTSLARSLRRWSIAATAPVALPGS
jgi:hypothetical protein